IISISAILKDCSRLPCSNLTINLWFMPKIEILQSGWGSSASALILYDSLCFHGVGHLNEPADVSAFQVIDISIIFLTVAHTGFMDIFHDRFQATIYFTGCPLLTDRILRHLKPRHRYTTGICSLSWCKMY